MQVRGYWLTLMSDQSGHWFSDGTTRQLSKYHGPYTSVDHVLAAAVRYVETGFAALPVEDPDHADGR